MSDRLPNPALVSRLFFCVDAQEVQTARLAVIPNLFILVQAELANSTHEIVFAVRISACTHVARRISTARSICRNR